MRWAAVILLAGCYDPAARPAPDAKADGRAIDGAIADGAIADGSSSDGDGAIPEDAPGPADAPCEEGTRCDADPCHRCVGGACVSITPDGCTGFACSGSSSCYVHCPTDVTHVVAQFSCDAIPGESCLVTIDDPTEDLCVYGRLGANSAWIGLAQSAAGVEPDQGWAWDCGKSLHRNWEPGEPNQQEDIEEDCAILHIATATWFDVPCGIPNQYVCEIP